MPRIDLIQPRGGTAAEWTSANPVLDNKEYGFETDTTLHKYGDGVTAWNDLPYANSTAPTIQQVLTEGNIVSTGTSLRFNSSNPSLYSSIYDDLTGSLVLNALSDDDEALFQVKNNEFFFRYFDYLNAEDFELILNKSNFIVKGDDPLFKGLVGSTDYSANYAADDNAYVQNGYVKSIRNKGVATYSATSTATTILDLDIVGESHYQVLTVNTDIKWSNTVASGVTEVRTFEVIGAFSLTFSTATKVIGTYVDDGTTVNLITVNFANYPTVGLRTTVLISQ